MIKHIYINTISIKNFRITEYLHHLIIQTPCIWHFNPLTDLHVHQLPLDLNITLIKWSDSDRIGVGKT